MAHLMGHSIFQVHFIGLWYSGHRKQKLPSIDLNVSIHNGSIAGIIRQGGQSQYPGPMNPFVGILHPDKEILIGFVQTGFIADHGQSSPLARIFLNSCVGKRWLPTTHSVVPMEIGLLDDLNGLF